MMPWMLDAYYAWCRALNRVFPTIATGGLRVRVGPDVCKPYHEEFRLAELVSPGSRVLDLGTGTGIIALACARRACEVVASDVSASALDTARANVAAHPALSDRITLVHSDVYERIDGTFDAIVCHAPYLEVASPAPSTDRCWASAPGLVDRILGGAAARLRPDGELLLLWLASGRPRLEALAARHGLVVAGSTPWVARDLRLRALRWCYLDVAFDTALHRLRRAPEWRAGRPPSGR